LEAYKDRLIVEPDTKKLFRNACCRLFAREHCIHKGDVAHILCTDWNLEKHVACTIVAKYWKSADYTMKKCGLIPAYLMIKGQKSKIIVPPGLESWDNFNIKDGCAQRKSPPELELERTRYLCCLQTMRMGKFIPLTYYDMEQLRQQIHPHLLHQLMMEM
jgi:hypothetical protein